jgi:hypothetical protein
MTRATGPDGATREGGYHDVCKSKITQTYVIKKSSEFRPIHPCLPHAFFSSKTDASGGSGAYQQLLYLLYLVLSV